MGNKLHALKSNRIVYCVTGFILSVVGAVLLLSSCGKQEPLDLIDHIQRTTEDTDYGEPAESGTSGETSSSDDLLEVHFIDVGQGDCALVICGEEAMLIDGGAPDKSDLVYSYLKNHGIDHLKYIVATHADEDHIGGLSGALQVADCEHAFCSVSEFGGSRAFDSFVKYLGSTALSLPTVGERIDLGSAEGVFVGPISQSEDSNNNSLILKLTFRTTSFLFTGDAEEKEEKDLLASGTDLKATVLKVAHHGSSSSTSLDFLAAVSPEYAVISCSMENEYHHPNDQTLERLNDFGISLFRTDIQGHIICRSDGEHVIFETEKKQDADTYISYNELHPDWLLAEFPDANSPKLQEERLYVLNTRSHIIHIPECESAAKISEKNRLELTAPLVDILEEYPDYRPCGICHAGYQDSSSK